MIEKLREFAKSLNFESVKNLWKEEWTPIAVAVAGVVLLLVVVSLVRGIKRRRERRRIMRASEKDLGYDPASIPSGVAGLAFQFFLCGVVVATSVFHQD